MTLCSRGLLGLITCDGPTRLAEGTANERIAWTGIQLTDQAFAGLEVKGGGPWSSRRPRVLGHVDELISAFDALNALKANCAAHDAGEPPDAGYAAMIADLEQCLGEMGDWADGFVRDMAFTIRRHRRLSDAQAHKLESLHRQHCE